MLNKIKYQSSLNIFLLIFFSVLYFLRLYNKSFYDDEIGTINVLNNFDNIFDLYLYINSWDVSPPLSYILVYLGEKIFSFQYATLLILPLQIYCLNSFSINTSKFFENNFKIKSFYLFVTILNPTLLLWCTSLRWYSLWTPLALYVIGKYFFKKKLNELDIFLILIAFTIMFHLNYFTLIFVISLAFSNYKKFFENFYYFIKNKPHFFIILILLNLPQFYYFLTIHILNSSSQYGSFLFSFLYPVITSIFGNSVFPLEIVSLLFIFTLLIIIFYNFRFYKKINLEFKNLILFSLIFFLLIFLLRLGHKPRHSIILNYLFIFFFFVNLLYLKNEIFKNIFLIIFFIFSLIGIKNTILQQNVIKNNINLPIKKIISFLEKEKVNCENKFLFTHNLNIKFYIKNKKNFIINEKNLDKINLECTFVIKTFIGGDNISEIKLVNHVYDKGKLILRLKEIEYDKFSDVKERLFKNTIKNNFEIKILY